MISVKGSVCCPRENNRSTKLSAQRPTTNGFTGDSFDRTLLVFHVDGRRYALHIAAVQRVLPMLDVAPLPGAPAIVSGVVNVAGSIVPVMDVRGRFALPARQSRLSDVLILASTAGSTVALPADGVWGVAAYKLADATPTEAVAPGTEHIKGVVKLDDGLVLIHDLDGFLSSEERTQLVGAMRTGEAPS